MKSLGHLLEEKNCMNTFFSTAAFITIEIYLQCSFMNTIYKAMHFIKMDDSQLNKWLISFINMLISFAMNGLLAFLNDEIRTEKGVYEKMDLTPDLHPLFPHPGF